MSERNGTPVLLGPNGRPYEREEAKNWQDRRRNQENFLHDGMPLPHVISFGSLLSGANHTYWHARFDEAMKHDRRDALVMENDCYLMGLIQERKLSVASLPWHIDVPNEKEPKQQEVQKALTEQIEQIPGLQRIFMSLLEALWFGRYGVQVKWDKEKNHGREMLLVKKWKPINGDKIGHQHDDTPYILGHAAYLRKIPGAELIQTQGGSLAMRLNRGWRDRFVIHKHEVYDGDFLNAEKGEAVHGLGIRSRVFWMNWLKLEYMGAIVDFMERVGLGVTLWYYDASNPKSKIEAAKAAKAQSDRTNLLVPYWPSDRESKSIERIETPATGAELLLKLQEQIDKYLERYIVGQEMSSSANSTGLGNESAAEFQQATKAQITKYDANNLAETLTGSEEEPGFVWMMQRFSFPETLPSLENPEGFRARLVFNIEGTQPEKELEAAHKLWSMNLSLKSDEIRSRAGYSKPEEGDEILPGQMDQQAQQQQAQQQQMQAQQQMPQPGAEEQLEEPEQDSDEGGLDELISIMEQMQRPGGAVHYQIDPDAGSAEKYFPAGLDGVELDDHPLRYESQDWEPWVIQSGPNEGKQAWKHRTTHRVRLTQPGQEEGQTPTTPKADTGEGKASKSPPPLEPATPLPEGPKGIFQKIKALLGKFNPSFSLTDRGFERLPESVKNASDLGFMPDDQVRPRTVSDTVRNELNARHDWASMPDEHIDGLMIYSGGNYKEINTALRAGVLPESKTNRAVVEWLDEAFEANPDFEKPVTVYKGASFTSEVDQKRFLAMLMTAANENVAVSLGGYQSTTVASEIMNHFSHLQAYPVCMEIAAHNGIYMERAAHANTEVQKGKDYKDAIRGVKESPDLQPFNQLSVEREMLLSRDTKYRVVGFKEVEFIETGGKPPVTKMVVQLEQIPGRRAAYKRDDSAHYDRSEWISWIIQSGPRKGLSAFKNIRTGAISDTFPDESKGIKPSTGKEWVLGERSKNEKVNKIIDEVVAEQIEKWGTYLNSCEDTSSEVARRAFAQFIYDVEIVEGYVQLEEGGEIFPHHWLEVDGEDVDPTSRQFGLPGYSSDTHFRGSPDDNYGRTDRSAHYDRSEWIPWTIKSGPNKGQSAYKNTRTNRVARQIPQDKKPRPDPKKVASDVVEGWEVGGNDREELTKALQDMTVKSIDELKKELGLRIGGKKAEKIAKLVDKIEKIGQSTAERFKAIARHRGISWDRVQSQSAAEREVFNEHVDLVNQILKEARRMYAQLNQQQGYKQRKLDRSLKVFRDGGDWTELPSFDMVAEDLQRRYPEVFGTETPEEVLWDLVAGGAQKRMTRKEAYQSVLDVIETDQELKDLQDAIDREKESEEGGEKTLGESIVSEVTGLFNGKYADEGQVPIHEIRQRIKDSLGGQAASPKVFDAEMQRLRREGEIDLIAISDMRKSTQEQLDNSIEGVGETFFYVTPHQPPRKDFTGTDYLGIEWRDGKRVDRQEEPGFTGTDSLGREWRDGKLVPAEEKGGKSSPADDPVEAIASSLKDIEDRAMDMKATHEEITAAIDQIKSEPKETVAKVARDAFDLRFPASASKASIVKLISDRLHDRIERAIKSDMAERSIMGGRPAEEKEKSKGGDKPAKALDEYSKLRDSIKPPVNIGRIRSEFERIADGMSKAELAELMEAIGFPAGGMSKEKMKRQLLGSLERVAVSVDQVSRIGEDLHTITEDDEVGREPKPPKPKAKTSPEPTGSSKEKQSSFIVDAVAGRDVTDAISMKDLYRQMKEQWPEMGLGEFHDTIRNLSGSGQIRLRPYTRGYTFIAGEPEPIFQDGEVMYWVTAPARKPGERPAPRTERPKEASTKASKAPSMEGLDAYSREKAEELQKLTEKKDVSQKDVADAFKGVSNREAAIMAASIGVTGEVKTKRAAIKKAAELILGSASDRQSDDEVPFQR